VAENPLGSAETVRVFLVWDTDVTGVSLHSIWTTREGAEEGRRPFANESWIEERVVCG
jgi:uncharacterized protein YfaP (DUF2135 family)